MERRIFPRRDKSRRQNAIAQMRTQSFKSVVKWKNHRVKMSGFPGKTQFNSIDVERVEKYLNVFAVCISQS